GSAGAGEGNACPGLLQNIRLRWSRGGECVPGLLQNIRLRWSREIFRAGAATNIRLRWSRGESRCRACYKRSAPLEPTPEAATEVVGLDVFGESETARSPKLEACQAYSVLKTSEAPTLDEEPASSSVDRQGHSAGRDSIRIRYGDDVGARY